MSLLDSIAGVVVLGLVVSLLALSFDQKTDAQSSETGDRASPSGGTGSAFIATGPAAEASGTRGRDAVVAGTVAPQHDAQQELRARTNDAESSTRQAVVLSGWQASIATDAQSLINGIERLLAGANANRGDTRQKQEESGAMSLCVDVPVVYVHTAFDILLDLQSLAGRIEVSALARELHKVLIASKPTKDGLEVEIAHACRFKEILNAAQEIAYAIVLRSTVITSGPGAAAVRL